MKAYGFIQIVPERHPDGSVRRLKMERVSSRYPQSPLPGAITVRVALDVPDEIASVQTVEAAVEAGCVVVTLPLIEDAA